MQVQPLELSLRGGRARGAGPAWARVVGLPRVHDQRLRERHSLGVGDRQGRI